MDSWHGAPDSAFDEDLAQGYVGRYLLAGITRLASDGTVIDQRQLHGVIVNATAAGIDVELHGAHEGRTWRIPPCLDDLHPAKPGRYELKSSGEVVEDPDFLFTVTVRQGARQ